MKSQSGMPPPANGAAASGVRMALFCLRGGRRARCDLRKDSRCRRNNYFQQRQRSNGFENSNAKGSIRLEWDLVAQMAVRAVRVIRGIGMMPVADDAGSKDQQRYERQRYPKNANSFAHDHFVETGTRYNPPSNSSVI